MIFRKTSRFEPVVKTGFYVSLVSYLAFWLLDAVRPGFVSRTFSLHLFLLGSIVFGIWWAFIVKEYHVRSWLQCVVAIILGIILSVISWKIGQGFGAWRFLIVLITLFLPLLFWRMVKGPLQ